MSNFLAGLRIIWATRRRRWTRYPEPTPQDFAALGHIMGSVIAVACGRGPADE